MDDRALERKPRNLRRSVDDRMVAGVMGGVAKYFGVDPTAARVIFVLVSVLSAAFPGIFIYLVMWLLIPEEGT